LGAHEDIWKEYIRSKKQRSDPPNHSPNKEDIAWLLSSVTLCSSAFSESVGKAGLLFLALMLTAGVGTFTYFYVKYARLTMPPEATFLYMSLLYARVPSRWAMKPGRNRGVFAPVRYSSPTAAALAGTGSVRPIEINPGRTRTITKAP